MTMTRIVSYLVLSFSLIVSGCGGSSDTDTPDTTNSGRSLFTVTVNNPVSQNRIKHSNRALTQENFEVAVVDESGIVIEVVSITSENIIDFGNGSYGIYVPGNPRLDCVIVADISGTITVTVGNPLPANSLYAPTTTLDVDIDVQSTLAYQNFLETVTSFSDYTNEDVENLINQIQEIDVLLPVLGQTLEEYLAVVEQQVSLAIDLEIQIINNAVVGDLAALLETDGAYDLEVSYSQFGSDVSYSHFFADSELSEFTVEDYYFNGITFVFEEPYNCATNNECEYVLSPTGWIKETNSNTISYNSTDNIVSVTDGVFNYVLTSLAIDLSAQNMATYALGSGDSDAGNLLAPSASFSSGAEVHRVAVTQVIGGYTVNEDMPAYVISGDGDVLNDGEGLSISSLDEIIVPSASTVLTPLSITGIRSNDFIVTDSGRYRTLILEFVESGVLNFYTSDEGQFVGAGTWVRNQVYGEDILVVLTLPINVETYVSFTESNVIFSIVNNVLLQGDKTEDGSYFTLNWYNKIAFDDFINNLSFNQPVLEVRTNKSKNTLSSREQKIFEKMKRIFR